MSVDKTEQGSEMVEVTDARKHPFFVLDNDLIAVHGPKIGVYGIAVYNVLAYYANKKDVAWPSYQTIADHLGMSRPKVVTTIETLVACGLIKKEARYTTSGDQTSNSYTLVSIHGEGSKQDLPPSKPHLPPSKQDLPRGSKPRIPGGKRRIHEQDPMNNTHSLEQEGVAAQPTPQQEMFAAVCEAIGWDHNTLTKDDKGQVAQAMGFLSKANYTVDDIHRFMVEVWFRDWRWEKKHEYPTLKVLRQEIGKIRSAIPSVAPPAKEKGIVGFRRMLAEQDITI